MNKLIKIITVSSISVLTDNRRKNVRLRCFLKHRIWLTEIDAEIWLAAYISNNRDLCFLETWLSDVVIKETKNSRVDQSMYVIVYIKTNSAMYVAKQSQVRQFVIFIE